jgi:DNA-binding transcriptional ArsR family regulator
MSDNAPDLMNAPVPKPVPPLPKLDPARVHAALGNPLRYEMVKLLADGSCFSPQHFTERFKGDYENINKHCRILRDAGVISIRAGGDGRYRWYEIPPAARITPGVLDYGVCVVRLG